jgi:hypothetical protein
VLAGKTSRLGKTITQTTFLLSCIVIGSSSTCEAQNTPVVKVHAYQRDVVGGIPGGPPGVGAPGRRTSYVIYLETPPTSQFVVEGVWIGGKYHAVETAIKNAPIRFESPVTLDKGADVAVPATANTVTEIVVKDPVPGRTADSNVTRTLARSQAAVQVSYLGTSVLVPVDKFAKGPPIYLK